MGLGEHCIGRKEGKEDGDRREKVGDAEADCSEMGPQGRVKEIRARSRWRWMMLGI